MRQATRTLSEAFRVWTERHRLNIPLLHGNFAQEQTWKVQISSVLERENASARPAAQGGPGTAAPAAPVGPGTPAPAAQGGPGTPATGGVPAQAAQGGSAGGGGPALAAQEELPRGGAGDGGSILIGQDLGRVHHGQVDPALSRRAGITVRGQALQNLPPVRNVQAVENSSRMMQHATGDR